MRKFCPVPKAYLITFQQQKQACYRTQTLGKNS